MHCRIMSAVEKDRHCVHYFKVIGSLVTIHESLEKQTISIFNIKFLEQKDEVSYNYLFCNFYVNNSIYINCSYIVILNL